ncbi:MAG: MarR family transcriptional regulator [Eubacteriales bacterium]|nr:MarR family transcriptional regulator [Eubacteriales bacterium]
MEIRAQMELFNTCFCKVNELYREWAKRNGMSYNTMMTLYALGESRGATQKQIADDWLIPKQTVNTVVKDLEKRGLVRFEPLPGGRQKAVCLTEAGRAFADACLKTLYESEERAMRSLGGELSEAFLRGNLAYTEAFEKEVRSRG